MYKIKWNYNLTLMAFRIINFIKNVLLNTPVWIDKKENRY